MPVQIITLPEPLNFPAAVGAMVGMELDVEYVMQDGGRVMVGPPGFVHLRKAWALINGRKVALDNADELLADWMTLQANIDVLTKATQYAHDFHEYGLPIDLPHVRRKTKPRHHNERWDGIDYPEEFKRPRD